MVLGENPRERQLELGRTSGKQQNGWRGMSSNSLCCSSHHHWYSMCRNIWRWNIYFVMVISKKMTNQHWPAGLMGGVGESMVLGIAGCYTKTKLMFLVHRMAVFGSLQASITSVSCYLWLSKFHLKQSYGMNRKSAQAAYQTLASSLNVCFQGSLDESVSKCLLIDRWMGGRMDTMNGGAPISLLANGCTLWVFLCHLIPH